MILFLKERKMEAFHFYTQDWCSVSNSSDKSLFLTKSILNEAFYLEDNCP